LRAENTLTIIYGDNNQHNFGAYTRDCMSIEMSLIIFTFTMKKAFIGAPKNEEKIAIDTRFAIGNHLNPNKFYRNWVQSLKWPLNT
jgi:hypothetical protein